MKFFFTSFLLLLIFSLHAQEDSVNASMLDSIVVKAFGEGRNWRNVAAGLGLIRRAEFVRFNASSIVQAVNVLPGIRMEERSPGSYRFNIRGSSLRSPFGVRNVKVYLNDIPFTDPGGTTYLNSLGYQNINNLEIIKGPGSSLYGAGTGGVLLLESLDPNETTGTTANFEAGSFGYKNAYAAVTSGQLANRSKIGFQFQESEGYRRQSSMNRAVLAWNGHFFPTERGELKTTVLYSRLFYETPGALTKTEFDANPKAARPAGGGFPGAEQASASIRQTLFLAGLSYTQRFAPSFSNTTVAYGMYTGFENPAIRNYGQNKEPHTGVRTSFRWQRNLTDGMLGLLAGAEFQQSFSSVTVFKNRGGQPDVLQSADDLPTQQHLVFLQSSVEKKSWEMTAGLSFNELLLGIRRVYPVAMPTQVKKFSNELAPRFSLAYKWPALTVYTSLAKGFSPPTAAEVFPSGSSLNLSLNAERGTNNELGFRGRAKQLSFDVNLFWFRLQNTIVQRRDAGGGDYFINAGKTSQKGIETALNYPLLKGVSFIRQSQLWLNHTYHHFRYKEFTQLNTNYAGKRLPGSASHTVSTGLAVQAKSGWEANLIYYFSDRIPLNDANTDYAPAYHLLHTKIGFETLVQNRWRFKLTAGIENLLNTTYSLGNDINAFGGRYYNAAPGRNFYASLAVRFAR